MDSENKLTVPRRRPLLQVNTGKRGSQGWGAGGEETGNGELTEEEPLSPASKLFHEPHFDCCIIAILGYGRRLDVHVIKATVEVTLVRHRRFSSIPVWDEASGKNPRWVRTKVDLDKHLVVPDLDPLTTRPNPDQFVEDYVASLSTTRLDPSRPLWDLHLLNLRTTEAEAVAVLRIHHSLGDGTSLISLLLASARKTSDPDSLPTLPAARRHPAVRRRAGLRHLLLRAWATVALAWNTLVDVLLFLATAVFLRDTATPLMATEDGRSHPKRLVHRTVSLDDVKAVKNAVDSTINDVLIGVTSAGLSSYLGRRYCKKKRSIRLRTALIVNTRPIPGIQDLAKMMEGYSGGARWGNSIGYIILPLSVAMHEDPLDYVRKSKAVAERKKNSFEAIFTHRIAASIMKMFGSKVAAALSLKLFRQTTLTFSNNVGPVEEIDFLGHPIVYIAPGVFGLPHAITLNFQSYMNKMKIVMSVDEVVAPDPHELLDDLVESLKLIKDAAVASS